MINPRALEWLTVYATDRTELETYDVNMLRIVSQYIVLLIAKTDHPKLIVGCEAEEYLRLAVSFGWYTRQVNW